MLAPVWVRRSAIRPVPAYARVGKAALGKPSFEGYGLPADVARWRAKQPALWRFLSERLGTTADEVARGLGFQLAVCLQESFERQHGSSLGCLSSEALSATEASLRADEELRRADPVDPLETEDVVAMDQPALMELVNSEISACLERNSVDIDVDAVGRVFQCLLVEILALSHAVMRPVGYPAGHAEEPMA